MRGLVDTINVGPLLAVNLDIDVKLVHELRRFLVLERLVRHHVAPVTGGITDRKQNGLAFLPRQFKCFGAPGVPVDRVVRVLLQVRAGLVGEAVRNAHLTTRFA